MSHISFIDCYSQTPVNNCFNDFITRTNKTATYHMASQFGLATLEQEPTPTCYIILGSASHVHEGLNWHKELTNFIHQKLLNGIPVLGICFGHQLMANFYGSSINYIDHNRTEYKEVREIDIIEGHLGFKRNEKLSLAYCHSQIITELSDEFIELAKSRKFSNEIIKHKTLPFIGIQAHPEASLNFLSNEANVKDKTLAIRSKSDGNKYIDYFISSLK